mgnify:CR=1 FL=1
MATSVSRPQIRRASPVSEFCLPMRLPKTSMAEMPSDSVIEDFIVSNNLLPLGSLLYVVFCVSRKGWGWKNFLEEANTGKGMKLHARQRQHQHKQTVYYAGFAPAPPC